MKSRFIKEEIAYTGEQLQSHFAYRQYGILGDCIIGFRGPCDVKISHMVDIEDKRAGNKIYSEDMLHFIVEHHDTDLEKSVLRQWLLATIVKELINAIKGKNVITRAGSDLFDQDAKVTVSVATVTPVSSVIHFGINVTSTNTPVKTKGLSDYGIEPFAFANDVMTQYIKESAAVHKACYKVTWTE
ncbi:DUF366 family protein [candidate division WOR-3 bacterium]|nr:DUF366 family protein [candidate division WOR-3 bacterium]